MTTIGRLSLILAVSFVAIAPARAGWLSNLNPFASKQSSSDSGSGSASSERVAPGSSASLSKSLGSSKYNSKTSSMPSAGTTVVPQLNNKPMHPVNSVTPALQSSPSLLSRIGSAPSNLFSKTKSLFAIQRRPRHQRNSCLESPRADRSSRIAVRPPESSPAPPRNSSPGRGPVSNGRTSGANGLAIPASSGNGLDLAGSAWTSGGHKRLRGGHSRARQPAENRERIHRPATAGAVVDR